MMPLAFTPFIDPISALFPEMHAYWLWLVVPLVIAISLIYRTTRHSDLKSLPRAVTLMSCQILLVMVAAAVLLTLLYTGLSRWL